MKTMLVTGGAGFIGSGFIRYYFNKYPDTRIILLDALTYAGNPDNLPRELKESNRFEFWYGNVNNIIMVNELVARSDMVVHFAAETHVARSIFDNRIFFETDVMGTQAVANAVLKNKNKVERFIHISTSEVYGTAAREPMDEEHPLNPLTPYAAAKAGADRLVYSYVKTYNLPAIIIRPFNNYGAHQHLEKAVPRFITSVLLNEPLTVHGDGSAARDWVYVEDVAQAIDAALHADINKLRGEVLNVGTGIATSVLDIAKKILKIMGKPESMLTYIPERPGQVDKHISSTEKTKKLIGWKAATKLDQGLEKTIDWYTKNRSWWEPLRWMRTVPILTEDGKTAKY
jgi:dTDP-glucose 4,6-dehydratase